MFLAYKHSASLKMILWHPSEVSGPGKTQDCSLNAFHLKLSHWMITEMEKKAQYKGGCGQSYLPILGSRTKGPSPAKCQARAWAQPFLCWVCTRGAEMRERAWIPVHKCKVWGELIISFSVNNFISNAKFLFLPASITNKKETNA